MLSHRISQQGLSLVELMIGIAVALFILAAASTVLVGQLDENRRLLLETKVDQELRMAGELIVRDLRKAGFSQNAVLQTAPLGGSTNAYAGTLVVGTAERPTTEVKFALAGPDVKDPRDYSVIAGNEHLGYKLDGGMIRMLVGDVWQPLTDPEALRVKTFNVYETSQCRLLDGACAAPCTGPSCSDCPPPYPHQVLRLVTLTLMAEARHDARVSRQFSQTVRLRNDLISAACPAP